MEQVFGQAAPGQTDLQNTKGLPSDGFGLFWRAPRRAGVQQCRSTAVYPQRPVPQPVPIRNINPRPSSRLLVSRAAGQLRS